MIILICITKMIVYAITGLKEDERWMGGSNKSGKI